jgi:hypothetical protein
MSVHTAGAVPWLGAYAVRMGALVYKNVMNTGHMPGFFWVAVLVSITPPYVMLIRVCKLHLKTLDYALQHRLLPTVPVLLLAARISFTCNIYHIQTCHELFNCRPQEPSLLSLLY